MRYKRKCPGCPLEERTKVYGEGLQGSLIAFFGEAPGGEEDREGHPFVGPAGRFFNWGLFKAGIKRSQSWTSNCLLCRPPDNVFHSFEGKEAQLSCRKGFEAELQWLRENGVRVIVPLGSNSMHYFGIEGSITKNRGSVFQRDDLPGIALLPTYHPSFLNRRATKRGTGPDEEGIGSIRIDPKFVWIHDLEKARRLSKEGWSPPREDFNLSPSLQDFQAFVKEAVEGKKLVAVDIETTGFNMDYARIVVIGLALDGERALSVPLLEKGGGPYWKNGEKGEVRKGLNTLFQKCPLVFQNALFDLPVLKRDGYKIDWTSVEHDTMLLNHAISPELPHGIGFIVSLYGETPYWKEDLLSRSGSILEMENETLRRYNLRDCVVLHQVLPPMLKDVKELGTEEIYRNESLKLLKPIGKMKEIGLKLDRGKLATYKAKLKKRKVGLEKDLRKKGELPDIFSFSKDDDLRYFLFKQKPSKFKQLQTLWEFEPGADRGLSKTGRKLKPRSKSSKAYQNLLEVKRLKEEVKPIYLPKGFEGRKTRKTKKIKVDKQGRLSLQMKAQNRLHDIESFKKPTEVHLEEKAKIEQLLDWLEIYTEWAKVDKLLSTYTSYPTGLDGRVHTSLLIHGTATGRFSSRSPNLQNIPKKEIEARKPFVPETGYLFLSRDYSNLEVGILAYETEDPDLIAAFEGGVNIHDQNTPILFPEVKDSSHPNWKLARRAAKIFMFGGISYGGSDREIYEKVSLEVPELRLTFRQYQEAKKRFRARYRGYRRWHDGIEADVGKTRCSTTFHGRVRTLMGPERDILKQALNNPIQGGAGGVINRALIRLDEEMERRKLKSRIVLQIHDELLFEVWKPEREEMISLSKEIMEAPVNYRGREVIFPTDGKIGYSWGELEEEVE